MLPTHQHLAEYRGHAIYRRTPGFEYTPILLGRIASFLVQGAGGHLAIFVFMVPLLPEESGDVADDDALLTVVADVGRATIDRGALPDRTEATFEYRAGGYRVVTQPRWWVPTW